MSADHLIYHYVYTLCISANTQCSKQLRKWTFWGNGTILIHQSITPGLLNREVFFLQLMKLNKPVKLFVVSGKMNLCLAAVVVKTHMRMTSVWLTFPGGRRNTPWTGGLFCGLPDHHGQVLKSHRHHCTGNGECPLSEDIRVCLVDFKSTVTGQLCFRGMDVPVLMSYVLSATDD